LYGDDYYDAEHVIQSLQRVVPGLDNWKNPGKAREIFERAQEEGRTIALADVTPNEANTIATLLTQCVPLIYAISEDVNRTENFEAIAEYETQLEEIYDAVEEVGLTKKDLQPSDYATDRNTLERIDRAGLKVGKDGRLEKKESDLLDVYDSDEFREFTGEDLADDDDDDDDEPWDGRSKLDLNKIGTPTYKSWKKKFDKEMATMEASKYY
jgi:hypothetical protein